MFNILHRTILQDRRLSNLKYFATMKCVRSSRIGWIALFIGMTTSLFITENAAAKRDCSHFFPPMAIASHVTHWDNRPMHFACSVGRSACMGMDLDLTKMSAQEKAICAGAGSADKTIRDVIASGDLYRLEDPHEHFRGAEDFVSPDKTRAVVFVFQLQDGKNAPVRPQGLDPARSYTIHELNPAPGRAAREQEGKTFTGEELMRDGILPSCSKAIEASVVELE